MRITGGTYRSRSLQAPTGTETRPTSDRVREALFGILGARVSFDGVRVLDLYAGTGALGFEALSRGAGSVVFVEQAHRALAALGKNVQSLGVEGRCTVVASSLARAGRAVRGEVARGGPFGLVFADPPYALVRSGEATRALASLLFPVPVPAPVPVPVPDSTSRAEGPHALAPGAWLVVEHARGDAVSFASPATAPVTVPVTVVETRVYGDTALTFFVAASDDRTVP